MRNRIQVGALLAALHASAALGADLAPQRAALQREKDPARLEMVAVAIASSGDAAALGDLAIRLGEKSFLSRLDPARDSVTDVLRLGEVFKALAVHPSPATAALCIEVAKDPEFRAVPVRLNLLLSALAAVRPVSAAAATLFSATGRAGFLQVNVPLLAVNASPRALAVLAELLADESLEAGHRVSAAQWGIMPSRLTPGVAEMCRGLLQPSKLAPQVALGILESLFDYRPVQWFGKRSGQPSPPPWNQASAATASTLVALGTSQLRRTDLPVELRAAIAEALGQLRRTIAAGCSLRNCLRTDSVSEIT